MHVYWFSSANLVVCLSFDFSTNPIRARTNRLKNFVIIKFRRRHVLKFTEYKLVNNVHHFRMNKIWREQTELKFPAFWLDVGTVVPRSSLWSRWVTSWLLRRVPHGNRQLFQNGVSSWKWRSIGSSPTKANCCRFRYIWPRIK